MQAEVVREVVEATVRVAYSEPGDPELIALAVDGIGPARIETALARLVATGVGPETLEEAATSLAISPATAKRWWTFARTWLRRKLES